MTDKLLFWAEKATEFEKENKRLQKEIQLIEKSTDYLADKARELQAENQKLRNYIVKAMDYLEKAANKQGNPWKEAKMMRDPQTDLEVCEKATRGPWEYLSETGYAGDYPYSKSHRVKIGNKTLTVSCHIYGWEGEKEERANAELIALAREALPWWIKRVQELEAENKLLKDRLFLKCKNAEKLPNGQCRGFQVSHFDDEPIEQCKNCQKFVLYEPEELVEDCPEDWDENNDWVKKQVDIDD